MALPRARATGNGEARSAPHLRRLNRERILAIAMDHAAGHVGNAHDVVRAIHPDGTQGSFAYVEVTVRY